MEIKWREIESNLVKYDLWRYITRKTRREIEKVEDENNFIVSLAVDKLMED